MAGGVNTPGWAGQGPASPAAGKIGTPRPENWLASGLDFWYNLHLSAG